MDRLRCLATDFCFGRLFFLIAGVFAAAAFTPSAQAGAKRKPSVLIVNTLPAFFLDVQSQVRSSGLFAAVDLFNGAAATPSVASLKAYDAVLVASDNNFSDPYAITDFCFPEGRWKTQGYEIVPAPLPHPEFTPEQLLGTVLEPNHPIASFVRKLQISPSDSNPTPPLRGRTILTANDGGMLAAVHNFKKRADLGYWPVSSSFDGGWNRHTDGAWLAANALEFVVRVKPCPGDFNGDGQVDDTDFVLFIARYDSLLDPRADLTGDGNTDDADFSIFVVAYNELICP